MKFGPVPIDEALGAVLAHSVHAGERVLRKARKFTAQDIEELKQANILEVVVARLESDDVDEDSAAKLLVDGMKFRGVDVKPPATGRVNLHARHSGVFVVDEKAIDSFNAIDPAITIATLAQYAPVETGSMVATVKIIPYAVPRDMLDRALLAIAGQEILAVNPYRTMSVGLIQTRLAGTKPGVLDKTVRVTEARLARSGSHLKAERRVNHDTQSVAAALKEAVHESDMVLIFGASAVSDFDDVIPAAIRMAGGFVTRTGMPVDPGNLLVLGRLGEKPVIGAPGCARSPKVNGFDWVLDRTLAGIEISDRDIARMGVGGLLMEIPSRPQPRESARSADKVCAVILAAGRSSRMGGPNKLMAEFDGIPLVRRIAEWALASTVDQVVVVTGHEAERVEASLAGLKVEVAINPAYASGLSSSLKAGIAALPDEATGAMIILGDMPEITTSDINKMVAEFKKAKGAVVRATHQGKRGNPVILPRSLFETVATLEGDTGARHVVEAERADIIDIELGESASIDVDTPDAMERAGGKLRG
ncbi:MAG: molybdopterin-binding/glycosyltransferase family 2 protein [Rhizobiaceae bacterium]|nr:molybdopterin-binding/glycosyltransferase family 2 protein [Rhizobiaceae bacterium]